MALVGFRYFAASDPGAVGAGYENVEYWTGFLMSDGCVSDDGRTIQCRLSFRDIEHLNKMKRDLGIKTKLIDVRGKHTEVHCKFRDRDLHAYLVSCGVIPRKTSGTHVVKHSLNRDFWRGVVDGDGCLRVYEKVGGSKNYPIIKLVGCRSVLESFTEFVLTAGIRAKGRISRCGDANCYTVTYSGNACADIVDILYSDSTIYLDRKMDVAREIISLGWGGSLCLS